MKLLDNNGLAYFWSKVKSLIDGLQLQVDDLKNNQGGDITDIDGGGP